MKDINDFLIELEGFRNKVYKDSAGLPTIGIGHLLTQDELNSGKLFLGNETVRYSNGLTNYQVKQLLSQDLIRFKQLLAMTISVPLSENQDTALLSFSFNVGPDAFRKSTLRRKLNKGDYEAVPFEMIRWVYSGGEFIGGLKNRRDKEIEIWMGN